MRDKGPRIQRFLPEEIKRPHDSFFKRLMSDERVVREFLRGFLPEELSHAIDYDTVRIVDTEKTPGDTGSTTWTSR